MEGKTFEIKIPYLKMTHYVCAVPGVIVTVGHQLKIHTKLKMADQFRKYSAIELIKEIRN